MRIAFIGVGSAVFGRRLVTDLLYFPELREGCGVRKPDSPKAAGIG